MRLTTQRKETLLAIAKGHATSLDLADHLGIKITSTKTRIASLRRAGLIASSKAGGRSHEHGAYVLTDAGLRAIQGIAPSLRVSPRRKVEVPKLSMTESRAALLRILAVKHSTSAEVATLLDVSARTARRNLRSAEDMGLVVTLRFHTATRPGLYGLTPLGHAELRRFDCDLTLNATQESTILGLDEDPPINTVALMMDEYPIQHAAAHDRFAKCKAVGLIEGVADMSAQGCPTTYYLTRSGREAVEAIKAEIVARRGAA